MHPSPAFAWTDREEALAFVGEIAFAHVFVATPYGPRVAHVPVVVVGGALRFHLANGNVLTPYLDGAIALASIGGPNAYVSPNWYADGRGQVPTWNYLAVEVEGIARRLDSDALVALLDSSAATHEGRVGQNWTRAKMDPHRFEAMCRAITGFELPATTIRATRKLGQNKTDADMRSVAMAQRAGGQSDVAALVEAQRGW